MGWSAMSDPYAKYLEYLGAALEVARLTDTHSELTSAATLLLAGALRHVEDRDLVGLGAIADVAYLSGLDARPSTGRTH